MPTVASARRADVLPRLYRLFGYQGLELPPTTAALDKPEAKLHAIVAGHEIVRMARVRPSGLRIYPPLPGRFDGRTRERRDPDGRRAGDGWVTISGMDALSPAVEQQLSGMQQNTSNSIDPGR